MRSSSRQQRERVRHCRIDGKACTLTISTNTAVAFPVGTRIDLPQHGGGQVTIGGSGVTIRSSSTKLRLAGQYSGAILWKIGTNEWKLILADQTKIAIAHAGEVNGYDAEAGTPRSLQSRQHRRLRNLMESDQ